MVIETNCKMADILKESTPQGIGVRIGRQTAYGTNEYDTPALVYVYIRENRGDETKKDFVNWLMNDELEYNQLTILSHDRQVTNQDKSMLEDIFDLTVNRDCEES